MIEAERMRQTAPMSVGSVTNFLILFFMIDSPFLFFSLEVFCLSDVSIARHLSQKCHRAERVFQNDGMDWKDDVVLDSRAIKLALLTKASQDLRISLGAKALKAPPLPKKDALPVGRASQSYSWFS